MQVKTDSRFRLSKSAKMMMANFPNAHERGAFKRAMISAQLVDEAASRDNRKGYLEMFKGL